jgi:hypothetical protein
MVNSLLTDLAASYFQKYGEVVRSHEELRRKLYDPYISRDETGMFEISVSAEPARKNKLLPLVGLGITAMGGFEALEFIQLISDRRRVFEEVSKRLDVYIRFLGLLKKMRYKDQAIH